MDSRARPVPVRMDHPQLPSAMEAPDVPTLNNSNRLPQRFLGRRPVDLLRQERQKTRISMASPGREASFKTSRCPRNR